MKVEIEGSRIIRNFGEVTSYDTRRGIGRIERFQGGK